MTDIAPQRLPRLSRRRQLVDGATRHVVGAGGVAVICAIALIMGYLVWVIVPMLAPSSIKHAASHTVDVEGTLHIATDDTFETATFVRSNGIVEFRDTRSFELIQETPIAASEIDSVKPIFPTSDSYAIAVGNKKLAFFKVAHVVRFLGDQRRIENSATTLFEDSVVELQDVVEYDVYRSESTLRVALLLNDGSLVVNEYDDVDDYFELDEPREAAIPSWNRNVEHIQVVLGPRGRWLYEIDTSNGDYRLLNIASIRRPRVEAEGSMGSGNDQFLSATPVLGRYSFLVAYQSGMLAHWSLTPSEHGSQLQQIRSFDGQGPIASVITEHRRKGFLAIGHQGLAQLGYTTSRRILAKIELGELPEVIEFSPRADRLLAVNQNSIDVYNVVNKHPEISWSTLWGKVWYEGYQKPVHSWQSSSADTDFEPKFSLTPLLFGTIKAAFYAMLVATPLAIMGAIYTAVFMSPGMRKLIKPGIEIMAALPTVILGFLAGLWLAPIVETHLTSILLLIIILPLGVLICAFLTTLLPRHVTARFDGWFAALSVPILVILGYLTLTNDAWLSNLIFGMDAKLWFYEKAGIDYDQRNALVIGIAMGLAVIPTIFSISEDAIYGVPQHLVHGSLALGATRWQTLVRVVLLTASPGIFSAVMIGLGRAVGETMIVLMATGNTPIMDINIFQGMRTFAANIAVEMPESEVGSTHFRILFLTAFVLFALTFLFNTVAEVVRQRLRSRYGNL